MDLTTPSLNAMWQAEAALLNGGSIEFLSSGGTVLASCALAASAGAVANGVLSLAGFPKSFTALAVGTIASARLRTGGGSPATAATLKVGATGETDNPASPFDVVVSTRTIEQAGQSLQITNTPTMTFTPAA